MNSPLLMIALRLLHVLGGIFWVGAMLVTAAFLYPAAREGPDGGRVLQQIMVRHRLSSWLSTAAGITMLSGLLMYGRFAMSGGGAWMRTRGAVVLGIGGLFAIAAAATAGAVLVPGGRRLGELGARARMGGAGPDGETVAEMTRLQTRLFDATRIVAGLLVLTAAAMAVARYV